jgi:hypothetical protein
VAGLAVRFFSTTMYRPAMAPPAMLKSRPVAVAAIAPPSTPATMAATAAARAIPATAPRLTILRMDWEPFRGWKLER